jgi:hypothetical protein
MSFSVLAPAPAPDNPPPAPPVTATAPATETASIVGSDFATSSTELDEVTVAESTYD